MMSQSKMRRLLMAAMVLASGSTFMTSGCSIEAIRALIIGLDAAAGQIQEENRDITFSDWLEDEFDDVFDDR